MQIHFKILVRGAFDFENWPKRGFQSVADVFISLHKKNAQQKNFVMGLPVILLNHLEDNPAIILSQI